MGQKDVCLCFRLCMCVVECVGVGALSFLCIYQPESVLNGFMNGFLGCVCVCLVCVFRQLGFLFILIIIINYY